MQRPSSFHHQESIPIDNISREFEAYKFQTLGRIIVETKDLILRDLLSPEEAGQSIDSIIHGYMEKPHIALLLSYFELSSSQLFDILESEKHTNICDLTSSPKEDDLWILPLLLSQDHWTEHHSLYLLENFLLSEEVLLRVIEHATYMHYTGICRHIASLGAITPSVYRALHNSQIFSKDMYASILSNAHTDPQVFQYIMCHTYGEKEQERAQALYRKTSP